MCRRQTISFVAGSKYQQSTNDDLPPAVEDWDRWLTKMSGKRIAARKPDDGNLKVLGDAPGTYVRVKA